VFALLTGTAFRIYRLLAKDIILDAPRAWLVGLPRRWKSGDPVPKSYREKIVEFLLCPWCLGFWICGALLAVFCATTSWLDWFGFFITWFAMSAGVGLIARLDADD
jgi:hypothetical protein